MTDIDEIATENEKRIARIEHTLFGPEGENGLNQDVRNLKTFKEKVVGMVILVSFLLGSVSVMVTIIAALNG